MIDESKAKRKSPLDNERRDVDEIFGDSLSILFEQNRSGGRRRVRFDEEKTLLLFVIDVEGQIVRKTCD